MGDLTPDRVLGDPTRLTQIFNNLLSNALKFTHEGNVTISASLKGIKDDAAVVSFVVSDTGIGIPKEKLDEMKLSDEDRAEYKVFLKKLRDIASEQHTKMADADDILNKGKEKGREEKEIEAILGLHKNNVSISIIASALNISEKRIQEVLQHKG